MHDSPAPDAPPIPQAFDFMGCPLHPIAVDTLIEIVADAASGGRRLRIGYLNAHTSNLCARQAAMREALGACDIVYADGQAVVWAARLLGCPAPERVNAGDFIERLLEACAVRGVSVYVLGSYKGVARRAAREWTARVSGLTVAGAEHGFLEEGEEQAAARRVRDSGAGLLLVGMGSPRQEAWMAQWGDTSGAPVVWCVGALFEYASGMRRRAPEWMRRAGLEWAFRLALEPGRLWRRYVVGNVIFLWRVLGAWLGAGRD